MRWGFIGASNIAERVTGSMRKLEGQTLVGVYSRTLSRAQAFAQAQGLAQASDDLQAFLAEGRFDAVYVSSTNFDGGVLAQTHESFAAQHAVTHLHVLGTPGNLYAEGSLTQAGAGRLTLRNARGEVDVPVPAVDLYERGLRAIRARVRGPRRAAGDRRRRRPLDGGGAGRPGVGTQRARRSHFPVPFRGDLMSGEPHRQSSEVIDGSMDERRSARDREGPARPAPARARPRRTFCEGDGRIA
jgi:hypothetical protein